MNKLVDRFLTYVKYDTKSDESSTRVPSTPGQLEFGKFLYNELKEIGLSDVTIDDNGYIMATLPSNIEKDVPTIGFIAHMDTSPDMSGKDVKPKIVRNYDGKDIVLNPEKNIVMKVSDFPDLKDYIGKDEAKAIALNHAGVNESAIRDYEIELDKDYNSVVYEIDFESNDTEYEYEIDAYTGEVLKSQSKVSNNTTSKSQTTYLSESKIKEIVFQHAGVNGGNVTELEIELDGNHDDDDTPIYEVDFQVDRLEYEYEVDAITGKIIESKVEQDD